MEVAPTAKLMQHDWFEFADDNKPAFERSFSDMINNVNDWKLPEVAPLEGAHAPDTQCISAAGTEADFSDDAPSSPDSEIDTHAEVGHKRRQIKEEPAVEVNQPWKLPRTQQLPVFPPMHQAPFHFAPQPQFIAPPAGLFPTQNGVPAQQRRGVAYDLNTVDERTKKRLLKNRKSAERSRQRKNEMLKDFTQQLHASQQEAAALRAEQEALRSTNVQLQRQNEEFRSLLLAHGIQVN